MQIKFLENFTKKLGFGRPTSPGWDKIPTFFQKSIIGSTPKVLFMSDIINFGGYHDPLDNYAARDNLCIDHWVFVLII